MAFFYMLNLLVQFPHAFEAERAQEVMGVKVPGTCGRRRGGARCGATFVARYVIVFRPVTRADKKSEGLEAFTAILYVGVGTALVPSLHEKVLWPHEILLAPPLPY